MTQGIDRGECRVGPNHSWREQPFRPTTGTASRTALRINRSPLVAQRLPIPLRDVCGPYPDSAIWKVVTSPSRLSYRPPGPVLESRHESLPLALRAGSGKLVDDRSRAAIAGARGDRKSV